MDARSDDLGPDRSDLPDLTAAAAVIFDLDGVITDTASVHTRAWTAMFDDYLRTRTEPQSAFTDDDYHRYVDGKPRYDGVRSFLASRGITLPEGTPEDPPGHDTVCALGNKKNGAFREVLEAEGADVFSGSLALLDTLRAAGVPLGCVSSSKNCRFVLASVGLIDRFIDIVDGTDAAARGLPGKPAPDTYLACAATLGVDPASSVMVEDAISGTESGAAGGFGVVLGVDRGAGADALLSHGATVVVDDLGRFVPDWTGVAGEVIA